MGQAKQAIIGPPAKEHYEMMLGILDVAEDLLGELQDGLRAHPGRPAQLSVTGLIAGLILLDLAKRETSFSTLPVLFKHFPKQDRLRWGIESKDGHFVTYRQVTHLWCRIKKALSDAGGQVNAFDSFASTFLERQVDASGINITKTAAFDGTVIMTTARTRWVQNGEAADEAPTNRKGAKVVSHDPDAAFGHYPQKDENKTGFALGFEAHLITPLVAEGEDDLTLVAGMTFQPNSTGTRPSIKDLILDRCHRYDTVIYDAGYHFVGPRAFSQLTDAGINRLFEPNAHCRDGGSYNGALLLDGDLFHPALPARLRKLPAKLDKRSGKDAKKLNRQYVERERYRYRRNQHTETIFQGINPAHAGKLSCSKVPASTKLPYDKPRCMHIEGKPHLCPDKRTVNVPIEMLNVARQAIPFGTPKWVKLYSKGRSQVETANSNVRHNYNKLAERKWCSVVGRVGTGFLFLIKLLNTNAAILHEHRLRKAKP